MTDVVLSSPGHPGRSLNRISIWPVEVGGYGIDFTYRATCYTDAEAPTRCCREPALRRVRQELEGAWFGPLPREQMRFELDNSAW